MSLTIEALKHKGKYVRNVYISSKAYKNAQLSYLQELCNANGIEPIEDDRLIEKLSLKENCYCIGVFEKFKESLKRDNHIVLYGFNDYGELGTILRSAISFDFKDIVLIASDIDYFDPRCVRASMGSIFMCNIASYPDFESYKKNYPQRNVYPFVSESEHMLSAMEIKKPYSIVISQDYDGLDEIFEDGYGIEHKMFEEISLSVRSSIILSRLFAES